MDRHDHSRDLVIQELPSIKWVATHTSDAQNDEEGEAVVAMTVWIL